MSKQATEGVVIDRKDSSDLLRRQFETNVFGLMDVTTATLPYMRAQKSGTIVNIGSRTTWKTEFVVRSLLLVN